VAAAYAGPHATLQDRLSVLRFVQDIPLGPREPSWPLLEEAESALPKFGNTPTLLCWGMRDFVFYGDFLAEWERRFPRAEVHRFEDAGHWLLEDAGDRIVPLVRRFLEAHPA
jgi:haloalkane dehalogenase